MPDSLLSRPPYVALSGRVAWRTADGCVLALPVGARPGFGGAGSVHRAVRPWRFRERRRLAALARMLAGARRIGRLRAPGGAPVYWVFRGRWGRLAWDVVVRPTGRCRADIVTVRRAGVVQGAGRRPIRRRRRRGWGREYEQEMVFDKDRPAARHGAKKIRVRGAMASIAWTSSEPLKNLEGVKKVSGDLYIVTRGDDTPLYAGLSRDFATRWADRFRTAKMFECGLDPFRIVRGTLTAHPDLRVKKLGAGWETDKYDDKKHRDLLRQDVEH